MKIKVGSKVKVIGVANTTNEYLYEQKKKWIGAEGTVYGTPCKYYGSKRSGYPEAYDGKTIYSVEGEDGKDVSSYAWFAEELELIE